MDTSTEDSQSALTLKVKKLAIIKFIGRAAILASLFNWVGFGLLNLDSQPYAFTIFTLFLISIHKSIKLPTHSVAIFFLILSGSIIAVANTNNPFSFIAGRAIFNYLSFYVIFLGFYNYLVRFGFPHRLFYFAAIIYLLGAIVEIFKPELVDIFAPRRTSAGRGVTSFTPEPTFFAILLFFSSWLMLVANNYRLKTRAAIISAQIGAIVLLAKSAMGALFLAIAFQAIVVGNFFRTRIKKKAILSAFLVALALIPLSFYLFVQLENSRLLSVLLKLQGEVDILDIFFLDASMNHRLEHVVFSLHSTILNFMVPAGFDSFTIHREYLLKFYDGYFWYGGPSQKVMSWLGDWIFQLGIFGLAIMVLLSSASFDKSYRSFLEKIVLFILLLSAIPVAFPLVPMLFATFINRKRIWKIKRSQ
jgi:hypothetical protein